MNIEDIPTQEVDACYKHCVIHSGPGTGVIMKLKMQSLERRLTAAREALEVARVGMCAVGVPNKAERDILNDAFDHVCETLKITQPESKP